MKSIPLTVTDPGEFGYTDGQTYYNEKLAYEILKHAAAMAAEGYEITFEESNLEAAWDAQESTLNQQSALITDLEADEKLSGGWKTRLSSVKSLITTLLSLAETVENFSMRSTMIGLFEGVIGTAAGLVKATTMEADELVEVLKAAFLKETVPDSGVYDTTTIGELKASQEQLEMIVQAIQALAATEKIVQCPHTGHYIYTKSLGKKTI